MATMQAGSAREEAMNAARRATMVKSTFASIRHLLDGNEFMNDPNDATLQSSLTDATHSEEDEDENPFKFIDQQFKKHELALFRESGSEDDSIDEFMEPLFQTDDFQASFPAFSSQSSIAIGDQSTGDLIKKGLLSAKDDFGFDEVNFDSIFSNETANHSNDDTDSRKDRSLSGRSSKRLNSSSRSRRKTDKNNDCDNISATENTEISNGSSIKRSINSSGSASRRTTKSKNNKDIETPRSKKTFGDDAMPMSPPAGHRRRKSQSGNALLSPGKSDNQSNKHDIHRSLTPATNKSQKRGDKPAKKAELNRRSIDMLKALAIELTKKSDGDDVLDATTLTNRVVTRVKELQASQLTKESSLRRSRSRSRGRLEKFDREKICCEDLGEKTGNTSKETRSRSRSKPRIKTVPSTPTAKSSKTPSNDNQLPVKKLSKSNKGREFASSLDLHPPLSEIKSPKAKSRRTKSNPEIPRSPPAALLDEIKSPKKSLKRRSKSSESLLQEQQQSADSSDDDIIEMLAKLVNQQLLSKDQQ